MGKLQVNMLGTSFTVRAKEDDEYLQKLYSYYKEIIGTISVNKNLSDPVQVSVLAGITLVDELLKAKMQNQSKELSDENESDAEELASRLTMEMIEKIDEVL
ncbi:MAG TPA: cell division protein ZapA [Treponema sp.]|jgi:cell division protein ZapA|nr:cell division protein ZapA [Treponema sp.]HAK69678.1 cell division protein ZapA [Treponema sp.]HBB43270.1 cell division protein ZapA [Treponema sp.]HCA19241.1 cell division protein ZapA [Treponema sp.]